MEPKTENTASGQPRRKVGRPKVYAVRRTQSDYNNNPRPINGRERKRVANVFFKDTAKELADYCQNAKVSQWGLIAAAVEVFLHSPKDCDYCQQVSKLARKYRTKWTHGTQFRHQQEQNQSREKAVKKPKKS